ncbi:PorH family porin [Corynebacterium pygosceleis]|uniref:PorH family porin n=1 Tax=Corynebacterium pygosceleis TaxID=2800406 RepID=A0A9Q4CBQ8_9CORY|nr:PorH family porin [Corynebacterium pygosceleis]MCK7638402.1 PorH family porin [Corynebacterium pygosceleis]MCK7675382.1 PorH family porin [Corynebacterium pygosceleis]MCL0121224.1 PorH family porin [Corynebacterium pygosceleis]MCX7445439.1 PorH family porin [Corynebacterium pygosceleis]MCX7469065.1 PorH family porin [Corynebacterium pygosceleis]
MDFTVIKEQLGDFSTFVDAVSKLIKNFPLVVNNLGELFEGKTTEALSTSIDGISSK